ncbi:MAG: hypothetical protein KGM24_11330, partial [Elusimicrobia bacterium]|nr:hypothetical protein [Elusimicrobiota bacterium]
MIFDRTPLRPLAAAFAAALLAAPAFAGVTVVENVRSGGFHGFGAYASDLTIKVDGVKSRQDEVKKHTGAVLKLFSGRKGTATDTILRVDLDKRWVLDPKRKTYREFPIVLPPDQRAEMERGRPQAQGRPGQAQEPTARIVKNEFKVEKTSDRKTLHGFDARRYAVSYLLEVEDLKTKRRADYKMAADYWTTPWTKELREAQAQREEFARAYLKKLGLRDLPSDPRALGLSMMAMMTSAGSQDVEKSKAEFLRSIAKLQGFPVVIDTRWYAAQV